MAAVVIGVLGCADWQVKGVFWQRFVLPAVPSAAAPPPMPWVAGCCRVTEVKQLWDMLLARRGGGQAEVLMPAEDCLTMTTPLGRCACWHAMNAWSGW